MSWNPSPLEMMELHVELQLGCYLDHSEAIPNDNHKPLKYVSSSRIEDYYWNLGYLAADQGHIESSDVSAIQKFAAEIGRPTAIWSGNLINWPEQFTPVSRESWMIGDLVSDHSVETVYEVTITQRPTPEMALVFLDAYGSTPEDKAAGYSDLPHSYLEAYLDSSSTGQTQIMHLLVSAEGNPAAIASVFVKDTICGLYNVGTCQAYRGRGLGSLVSKRALSLGYELGASRVLLQTESDSFVERMYQSLGLRRAFVASLLTPTN